MTDSRRQRRIWYAVGAVLVVAFLAYGTTSFKANLTPYVSFDEAASSGRKVQVAGGLVERSVQYVDESQVLRFEMEEEGGATMTVVYDGVKPGNFEEAVQIVAIGNYHDGAFHAEQLLVKCPSKYQGIEEDPSTHGGAEA
jgi:cytochrome c-type biogenesis protein CcmE